MNTTGSITDISPRGLPFVLGGNVFGWTVDRGGSFSILDAFVAGGGTMIDTADVYSSFVPGNVGGESEKLIGEWLKARGLRDDVFIATKVGLHPGKGGEGLAPARIEAAVDESLRRLNTDYIDLYYAHRDDPNTALEDVLHSFDRLAKAGKVRAIAASNFSADRLNAALDISERESLARYKALQPLYNLADRREFEDELLATCLERKLAVFPYFGLASGFLTGKYRSSEDVARHRRGSLVGKYLDRRGYAILAALDEVSAEAGASPARIALAWLRAQPGVTAPIASATNLDQLEDLLAASRLTLSTDQLDRLSAAAA